MRKNFQIQKNVPLAPLSTFGIGGYARMYVQTHNPQELKDVILWAREEQIPHTIFAGGSNVIFPDRGCDCLLVHNFGGKWKREGNQLFATCGVALSTLVDSAIRNGLSGLEYLSGIPGTVGGAIVGNAGAYGRSISDTVLYVDVLDGTRERTLTKVECNFSYRESIFKKDPLILLGVCLRLESGDRNELRRTSSEIIHKREIKYHPGIKCPGSFFKNVLVEDVRDEALSLIDQDVIVGGKIPAGYLLGEVGAKGMKIGGIAIAPYHGNLFINYGGGTASDVEKLAAILKKQVFAKFHIQLEEEIRYL